MRLDKYKILAQQIIDDINFYQRNKDFFKGVDDKLNDENNDKAMAKIAEGIASLAKAAYEDATSKNNAKPVAAVPFSHVDESGELKSCVLIAEEVYNLNLIDQ